MFIQRNYFKIILSGTSPKFRIDSDGVTIQVLPLTLIGGIADWGRSASTAITMFNKFTIFIKNETVLIFIQF